MVNCYFKYFTGNTEVTRIMLEAGAKTDITNNVGRNASQMAAFVGKDLEMKA